MRIVHVAPSAAPAELERIGAAAMAAAGHRVEVLVEDADPTAPRVQQQDDVTIRRFPTRGHRREPAMAELREHVRLATPDADVVHAHGLRTVPAVATAPPQRLVVTPRSGDLAPSRVAMLVRLLQPRRPGDTLVRAARVVAGSAGELDVLVDDVGVHADRIALVPEPIDAGAVRHVLPFRSDRPIAVVAGRLDRLRRVDRVVAALAVLPEYELVVVGRGSARRGLRRFAEELQVAGRVRFLETDGALERRRWLRTADVAVSVAERETTIVPLLEALALGTPVVASGTLAHVELTGYARPEMLRLVSPRSSPLAIADAIEALAASERRPTPPEELPSRTAAIELVLEVYAAVAADARSVTGARG
jgi:glycosyltransferase involved in cell wall biosynthesis